MAEKIDVAPDLEREVLVAVAMAGGSYGSDIISKIAESHRPSRSSAYRTLRNLERKGLVDVVQGRLIHTYTISEEGDARLRIELRTLEEAARRCKIAVSQLNLSE